MLVLQSILRRFYSIRPAAARWRRGGALLARVDTDATPGVAPFSRPAGLSWSDLFRLISIFRDRELAGCWGFAGTTTASYTTEARNTSF